MRSEGEFFEGKTTELKSHCQEKPRAVLTYTLTVLETDTGGQAEKAKGSERTSVKELGKITP